MATILELAGLSAAAYGDPIPPGWKVYQRSLPNGNGYYGVAYEQIDANGNAVVNPNGSLNIVIANRGTDIGNFSNLTNLLNLYSDTQLTLHVETTAQDLAAAFAKDVAARVLATNPTTTLIETGHSLGGSEAQAATVALTDYGKSIPGFSVSAVTFNSPGIGGYAVTNSATSYKVLNLYDQGDAIHLAGGVQLGSSTMLPAGPNT